MIRLSVYLALISLTGPDGHEIDLNVSEIVTLRDPIEGSDTFHGEVNCVIRSVDGNSIGVRETCAEVRKLIDNQSAR